MKKRFKKISYGMGSLIIMLIVSLISPLVMINLANASGIFEPLNVDLSDFSVTANPTMIIEFTIDTGTQGSSQIVATNYILVTLEYNTDQSESIEVTSADIAAADINLTCGDTTGAETDMENSEVQQVTVASTDNTGSADEIKITPNASGSFCTDTSDKYILTITSSNAELVNPTNADTYLITVETYTSGDVLIDGQAVAVVIGAKQLTIFAEVDPTLSLYISSPDCALGEFDSSQVNTCSYNTQVSTQSTGGYVAYIRQEGALSDANSNTINDSDTDVDSGTEEYGISTTEDLSVDIIQINDADGDLDKDVADCTYMNEKTVAANATPLTVSDQSFSIATGPVANDTVYLCHAASISGLTPAGLYSHNVIITLVAEY